MHLLIDADPLIYSAAFSCERVTEWDEGMFTYSANLDEARDSFNTQLRKITDCVKGTPILCLSDSAPSFRRNFWPTYKAGRGRRPMVYSALREWVLGEAWRTYLKPTLEADDILGILMTHPKLIPGEKVMVSVDKDMKQIPGFLLTTKPNGDPATDEPVAISENEADDVFFMQMLTGDATDNYPGIPGIGPKTAEKIILRADTSTREASISLEKWRWGYVVGAYEKAGLTADDALIQARCARILRAEDYDFGKGEPKLWEPK